MSDFEKLVYIQKNVPTLSAGNFEVSQLLDWFSISEQVLFNLYGHYEDHTLLISRLSGPLLHFIRTRSNHFKNWNQLKYEIFNYCFPVRNIISGFINVRVRYITRELDQLGPPMFKMVLDFHAYMQQLYSLLQPEIIEKQFKTLEVGYFEFSNLPKEFAATRWKIYDLKKKDENSLTPEEEDLLLNDPNAAQFWEDYKASLSQFLNESLDFGLCTNGNKVATPIEISKLSKKILNTL